MGDIVHSQMYKEHNLFLNVWEAWFILKCMGDIVHSQMYGVGGGGYSSFSNVWGDIVHSKIYVEYSSFASYWYWISRRFRRSSCKGSSPFEDQSMS